MTTQKPIHGEPKPKNIPSDMTFLPPIPCEFLPGDKVIFTNDYGAKFRRVVKGFSKTVSSWRFVYIDSDAWWFAHDPKQLEKTA